MFYLTTDLPILAEKYILLYPGLEMQFTVRNPSSILAIEAAYKKTQEIAVFAQNNNDKYNPPHLSKLFQYGCTGIIRSLTRMNESLNVSISGSERIILHGIKKTEPYIVGTCIFKPLPWENTLRFEALHRAIVKQAEDIHYIVTRSQESFFTLYCNQNPLIQIFAFASIFELEIERKHRILACKTRISAAEILYEYLVHQRQILDVQKNASLDIPSNLSKQQIEQIFREQLERIQTESHEYNSNEDLFELEDIISNLTLPSDIDKIVKRELRNLKKSNKDSSSYQLSISYLEFLIEMPWANKSKDNLDLFHAKQVLDHNHYDLEDVKVRIIEQLVVLKLNPSCKAPILCLVGPPGVGKTSLGKSIAKALNRKFERICLGGLHDESELRGHRRTYVGAMPGQIIKAIHRAEVSNPVLMLDEIDKIGHDFRGDPSSVLMEILDPAQNYSFRDNYLDCPFDLTQVFFITTANTLETISTPLLDRMEIIQLSGYNDNEKFEIAKKYLIPDKIESTGLNTSQITFTDKSILNIINHYTKEAGLRQLGQSLSRIARKSAVKIDKAELTHVKINEKTVREMLGPEKFHADLKKVNLKPGVAIGLAWTPNGGELLNIEATLLPGGEGLTLTGQLGNVMKESAQTAQSYLWANAIYLGIDTKKFTNHGLHIHIPEGATPKDGPSAGITIATAIASLYTNKSMKIDTAMTGELTLSGSILPIGGLKEKILAAHRFGYKNIIIPTENQKDLESISNYFIKEIKFIPVHNINEVLKYSLVEHFIKTDSQEKSQLSASL